MSDGLETEKAAPPRAAPLCPVVAAAEFPQRSPCSTAARANPFACTGAPVAAISVGAKNAEAAGDLQRGVRDAKQLVELAIKELGVE